MEELIWFQMIITIKKIGVLYSKFMYFSYFVLSDEMHIHKSNTFPKHSFKWCSLVHKYTEVKYPNKNDRFETNFWKHYKILNDTFTNKIYSTSKKLSLGLILIYYVVCVTQDTWHAWIYCPSKINKSRN